MYISNSLRGESRELIHLGKGTRPGNVCVIYNNNSNTNNDNNNTVL